MQRGTAYLTMLHAANDRGALTVLLDALAEHLRPQGVRALIGPTHLLPHLGGGVLVSHWHRPPPTDTPYAPPYLGEHLGALMVPLGEARLVELEVPAAHPGPPPAGALELAPLALERLAGDLLPLFRAAVAPSPALSPPDAAEVAAALRWWEPRRPFGYLALAGGAPVGFALLYEDPAARPVRCGRLLGGVAPAARGRGVGRALLGSALAAARARGWARLSVGPVPTTSAAEAFLRACGGVPEGRYTLYQAAL
ncbi:GNAT family N-acetyltransferase [Truepera radiovictrix]|uniref:GNAT family N-acetyltransferase n=1 Tax=Truepera radiovictrix TaxID=332249 RepID=UPI0002D91E1F|nr:GNAT family N-acetyltransferase [Truepera radiovictrix]WMT58686.1 GNAT family N-acetyltransferase [Truepera radiovictrix]